VRDADGLGHRWVRVVCAFAGQTTEAECTFCGDRWLAYPEPGPFPNPETLTGFCGRHDHDPDAAA
jgi:hypothetical protein